MSGIPVVLDSDPGLDDALALHYLLGRPGWELVAYTAVGGNVPVGPAFANARALAAAFGIDGDVPVYRGAGRPISRVTVRSDFHGPNGLGGRVLPDSAVTPPAQDAVTALLQLSRRHDGELTVIATGPLTNIAAALVLDPGFACRVRRLVFMGGAAQVPGNVTPVAEFNIWADPDAADIVVSSGIDYVMVGLDATRLARFTARDVDGLEPVGGAAPDLPGCLMRDYLAAYERVTGDSCAFLHDPLAVAVAADERFATLRPGVVGVCCDLGLTRGQTVFLPEAATLAPELPEPIRGRLDCVGMVAVDGGELDIVADFFHRLGAPQPR
jgi:purine nucleosidase